MAMKFATALSVLLLCFSSEAGAESRFSKAFKWSTAALIAGSSLDVASSYGYQELNRALATNGRFTARGTGIKFGAVAGIIVTEVLVMRRIPESRGTFTAMNYGIAGLYAGTAVRNWRVR